jgi:hypothetical protein
MTGFLGLIMRRTDGWGITKGSLAMLVDITEGSRAKLDCSVYPSMALDPSVMSMYHTGYSSLAL